MMSAAEVNCSMIVPVPVWEQHKGRKASASDTRTPGKQRFNTLFCISYN